MQKSSVPTVDNHFVISRSIELEKKRKRSEFSCYCNISQSLLFLLIHSMDHNAPVNKEDDPLLARLTQLTKDLLYMSESDYPLTAVTFSTPLNDARLVEFAQPDSPTGTSVKRLDLSEFLRHHTSEEDGGMLGDLALARRFQVLESFMKEELDDVHVYRVGDEPRIVVLALGTTKDQRRLVGFRTVSIET